MRASWRLSSDDIRIQVEYLPAVEGMYLRCRYTSRVGYRVRSDNLKYPPKFDFESRRAITFCLASWIANLSWSFCFISPLIRCQETHI
jgi:hypothetical protein